MKRFNFLSIFGAALLVGANVANAQDAESLSKAQLDNEFHPHWTLNLQAGAAYTLGEGSFDELLSPSAAISSTYQALDWLGVRVGISGWQAKGAVVYPFQTYKFNYLQGSVDAMFDLANIFSSYNPKRVVNPYIFLGVGGNGAFNNDEAVGIAGTDKSALQYLWRDNQFSFVGRGGLGVAFRVSSRVDLNLEANANILSDKFNSKKAENPDWQFNLLCGVSIRLGKDKKSHPQPVAEEELSLPVAEQKQEEAMPMVEVAKESNVPAEEAVAEKVTRNVIFSLNSAKVRSSQLPVVDEIVEMLEKDESLKVLVTGYADKQTGTADYNMKISRKRADAVRQALVDKGVSSSRIIVSSKGDTEQPFSTPQENRVCICIIDTDQH